jgi:plastocyanin
MKLRTACVLVALSACSNSGGSVSDAPKVADSHAPKDAASDGPADAHPDAHVPPDAAMMSSVVVVPNCTGVTSGEIGVTITTSGFTFSPSTATIAAGKYVKFTTTGFHNFQSKPSAPANKTFSSGPAGAQTACLQFTLAGSYPFECVVHASMGMTGTLTVQ